MQALISIVGIVFLVANVWTFVLYGIDKRRAVKNKWRIPEKTLLLHTWLLGGVGGLLGMKLFRHKTQHKAFIISCWMSFALTCGVMVWVLLCLTAVTV